MKKLILSTALVFALCLSFTSCREKKEATTEETTEQTTEAVEETTEVVEEVSDTVSVEVEEAPEN